MKEIKDTVHYYKGFEIIGTYIFTLGGWVLGGRYYKEGGIKRNYNIKYNGKFARHPDTIYETLKEVKEEIDKAIEKRNEKVNG